ncbi:hypothetical protein AB1Y20_010946 [Prymnesium parvum]|uniref:F-box domain-containing protein n=1 Tax=Prymnesium parvum TaxID=97485 RepID=A0AB34IQX1_PRYPA
MAASFDFPGWKFSATPGEGLLPLAQDSPAPTARAHNWLDDLDELDGGEHLPPEISRHTESPPATRLSSPPLARDTARLDGVWPDDVLFAVLSHVASCRRTLCTARQICSRWRDVASSDALWRRLWLQHPRLSRFPPRQPCGSAALGLTGGKFPQFRRYMIRMRADTCYRWLDLQVGWERLEQLLQPQSVDGGGHPFPAPPLRPLLSSRDDGEQRSAHGWAHAEHPQADGSVSSQIRADRLIAQQLQAAGEAEAEFSGGAEGGVGTKRRGCEAVGSAADGSLAPPRRVAPRSHGGVSPSDQARRKQAQKLAGILAARDWELLYNCVLALQLEYAECLAESIDQPADARGGAHASSHSDEQLLLRLLAGWQAYTRWLSGICGCFAHMHETPCRQHLGCIIAAQRASELQLQNTPSLMHAGFAAFRAAVLLRASIESAIQRHVRRASDEVMEKGGFTSESGKLMQQLIDLQDLLTALDVRDDHLSEERGVRFTQDECRQSLLLPVLKLWDEYGRSWFCGTKINPEDVDLYVGKDERRRRRQLDLQ